MAIATLLTTTTLTIVFRDKPVGPRVFVTARQLEHSISRSKPDGVAVKAGTPAGALDNLCRNSQAAVRSRWDVVYRELSVTLQTNSATTVVVEGITPVIESRTPVRSEPMYVCPPRILARSDAEMYDLLLDSDREARWQSDDGAPERSFVYVPAGDAAVLVIRGIAISNSYEWRCKVHLVINGKRRVFLFPERDRPAVRTAGVPDVVFERTYAGPMRQPPATWTPVAQGRISDVVEQILYPVSG